MVTPKLLLRWLLSSYGIRVAVLGDRGDRTRAGRECAPAGYIPRAAEPGPADWTSQRGAEPALGCAGYLPRLTLSRRLAAAAAALSLPSVGVHRPAQQDCNREASRICFVPGGRQCSGDREGWKEVIALNCMRGPLSYHCRVGRRLWVGGQNTWEDRSLCNHLHQGHISQILVQDQHQDETAVSYCSHWLLF